MKAEFEERNDLKIVLTEIIDIFDRRQIKYEDAIACLDSLRRIISEELPGVEIQGYLIEKDKNGN